MDDLTYDQKLRIEALRAASGIVAVTFAALISRVSSDTEITAKQTVGSTLDLAKQFYRYLETGDE